MFRLVIKNSSGAVIGGREAKTLKKIKKGGFILYKLKYQNYGPRAKALSGIYEDLMELGIDEVRRYRNEFGREQDYNLAQYGNLLVYYYQVRDFLISCGYTKYGETFKQKNKRGAYKISDDELWQYYKMLVRVAADTMLEHPEDITAVAD